MTVTSIIPKDYENMSNWAICVNEPNSNPIQTQFLSAVNVADQKQHMLPRIMINPRPVNILACVCSYAHKKQGWGTVIFCQCPAFWVEGCDLRARAGLGCGEGRESENPQPCKRAIVIVYQSEGKCITIFLWIFSFPLSAQVPFCRQLLQRRPLQRRPVLRRPFRQLPLRPVLRRPFRRPLFQRPLLSRRRRLQVRRRR